MTEQDFRKAQKAIEQIAQKYNTTVKMVRAHIQFSILSGFTNPDPAIWAEWAKIPREGEYPTPEEVIIHYAEKFKD